MLMVWGLGLVRARGLTRNFESWLMLPAVSVAWTMKFVAPGVMVTLKLKEPSLAAVVVCVPITSFKAAWMLATRDEAVALQVIGAVVMLLKVSVKVPPVTVPPKVMVWTAAMIGKTPAVVVATVTVGVVPVRLTPLAVIVFCGPGNWKVTVTVLELPEATFGLPWFRTTWAPGEVVPARVAVVLLSGPVCIVRGGTVGGAASSVEVTSNVPTWP